MRTIIIFIISWLILLTGSGHSKRPTAPVMGEKRLPNRMLVVLGIAQDAGYPQVGCTKECCNAYWQGKETRKQVTCLALVDRTVIQDNRVHYWLFEATPDITEQLHKVQAYLSYPIQGAPDPTVLPDGIFITHAHIGHYTGLMQLGREAMGASSIPVWAMPRLDSFLRHNGPWSQLVTQKNIQLRKLQADSTVSLNNVLTVTPIKVPHRDEYSETVGFIIRSDKKKVLFIPDIDKWEKWDHHIEEEIKKVDVALLDGTFYANGELPGRDMHEVPHPFVEESMKRFAPLPLSERSKIIFIHFNHTNPLLKQNSVEKNKVKAAGYGISTEGMMIPL